MSERGIKYCALLNEVTTFWKQGTNVSEHFFGNQTFAGGGQRKYIGNCSIICHLSVAKFWNNFTIIAINHPHLLIISTTLQ